MKLHETLVLIAIVAVFGGFVVPALAQGTGMERMPDQGMGMSMGHGMMNGRMMGYGMASGGMMSGGMMGGGMMSGMMGGDGRPNSQWQTHQHEKSTSD